MAAAHAAPTAKGAEDLSRASAVAAAMPTATIDHAQNHSRTAHAPSFADPVTEAYRNEGGTVLRD